MKTPNYQFEGMTMAVKNMDAMLTFYKQVFDIDFTKKIKYNTEMFAGKWGDMHLLFCPAELARITAKRNRHQFDIIVENIDHMIAKVAKHGGSMLGGLDEDDLSFTCAVYDPDQNSIVFKQYK